MTPFPFGFRKNNATESAILIFYDKLLNNLDKNKIICSIFLDLKKAFDSNSSLKDVSLGISL